MAEYRTGYIIGSIAEKSINRRLAKALVKLAPSSLELREIPIKQLSFYSYDYDQDYPPAARDFKQSILDSDAILIVTPEYNRSLPGVLKNAIDWASRPYGQNAFSGKPVGIIGASIGAIGTAVAQSHLRGVLGFCNAVVMGQPEAYITMKPGLIDENFEVTVDSTREFLTEYMKTFHQFIERLAE